MSDARELDDLDGLITHPGFQRLMAYAAQEWGPAGQRFQQAVEKAAQKPDAESSEFLRCIIFTQKELKRLLVWPSERVASIKGQAAVTHGGPSRRGAGL